MVSTSNYEARKYGVKAGVAIATAKKLLESTDATFLPMNRHMYESVSGRIMDILRDHGDIFERTGIDEAYLDVSQNSNGRYDIAETIGTSLKETVVRQEHITCSIGIAPNKLLAKIASDHVKPNGLTIVEPEEIHSFLNAQAVNRIPGVGKKVEEKLRTFNVRTIDDLARLNPVVLQESFGKKLGTYLFRAARGEDDEQVQRQGTAHANEPNRNSEGKYTRFQFHSAILERTRTVSDRKATRRRNDMQIRLHNRYSK